MNTSSQYVAKPSINHMIPITFCSQLALPAATDLSSPACQRSTTIHLNGITRDMRTRLTAQEQDQPTKVTRLANAASRLSRRQRICEFFQPKVCHARREDTRANDIDHDVLRSEFRSLHLGEVDACCLCWAV